MTFKIITCDNTYNYNPKSDAGAKLQITWNYNAGPTQTFTYTFQNVVTSMNTLISSIFTTFQSTTTYGISINYLSYETIQIVNTTPLLNLLSAKIYYTSNETNSYYLPLAFGFDNKKATATGNITINATSGSIIIPYWSYWRFPINSNSKVASKPNLVGQMSGWENSTVATTGGTEVTTLGVYNNYSRTINFKKVKLSNISWFNVEQIETFKSYASEPSVIECTITQEMSTLLFNSPSYTSVQLNIEETTFDSVLYEFENLIAYNVTMIPTLFLNRN